MKREDFVFTIGYQGDVTLVDGRAKKEYAKLTTEELMEKGLFRAAFCSALYEGDEEKMKMVVDNFKERSGAKLETIEDMKRMLGVYQVPSELEKVKVL
ncbi:MAG: hypothetical protein ACLFNZ_04210 [Spirochaetaceae bacterium]